MKTVVTVTLVTLLALMLPGCTGNNAEESAAPVTTEFERMLDYIPYSFLGENDIWFGNLAKAKELYGFEGINSLEELIQLPDDQKILFADAWSEVAAVFPTWRDEGLAPLVGFDAFSIDRVITINNVPPRISHLAEGNFDGALIADKLIGLDYEKISYGQYSYFALGGDLQIDFSNPLGKLVMAAMNRVAVLDNTLVISPVTEQVTGILDTISGDTLSVMDNAACQALADSLGDVLMAVITTPQRIIYTAPDMGNLPKFDFTIPSDWGQLHQYEIATLGYRADGNERFLDIALYYSDAEVAAADGQEIINRMSSYILNTWHENLEKAAFTDLYQPDEPVVTQYADGVVLKITCQLIPEERRGVSMLIGGYGTPLRDLLFLVSDPTPFILE